MLTRFAPRRWMLIPAGAGLILIIAAGWYLGSPLFIRTRLLEDSPLRPVAVGAGVPGEASRPQIRPPTEAEAAGPSAAIVSTGVFSDRDAVHRGSGRALLGRTPEGALVLRFEDFRVTNGPDLHVLLSRTEHPRTHEEVYNGVYVGKLRASEGSFHYELPPGTDVSGIRSVVVYCVPFRVIFTSAPLL